MGVIAAASTHEYRHLYPSLISKFQLLHLDVSLCSTFPKWRIKDPGGLEKNSACIRKLTVMPPADSKTLILIKSHRQALPAQTLRQQSVRGYTLRLRL